MKSLVWSSVAVFLVIVFSYWAIAPFFISGFFPMHDDTQVARVQQMAKSLHDGMFPVRWVLDLGYGYGYPIFSFYAPLAYYIGGLFVLLGRDPLVATKTMMVIGILLSGVSMYLLAREFWGVAGGVISALLYVYSPYHAVNIYVRGAVGEFYAYAFIPLVFYALWKLHQTRQFRFIALSALSVAAVILSHNLSALMLTPVIAATILFYGLMTLNNKRLFSLFLFVFAVFLGLLLSAFYWLPALLEMRYTNVASQVGGGADFRNHFVCLPQLWESMWGFGGSAKGCIDGMSFQIGKMHILLAGMAAVMTILLREKYRGKMPIVLGAFALFVLGVFLMLRVSQVVWEALPFMAYIQYPWRFLAFTALTTSFLSGMPIMIFASFCLRKNKYIFSFVWFMVVGVIIFFYAKLFMPQTIYSVQLADFLSEEKLRFTVSKISDEYMPSGFRKPHSYAEVPRERYSIKKGKAEVRVVQDKTNVFAADINAKTTVDLLLNVAYFPSWRLYRNGEVYSFRDTNQGILVKLPAGSSSLVLRFEETAVEKLGNLLSFIGVGVMFVGIIVANRRHFYEQT